jgi:Icc-related predicted phosphoesterase
MRLFFVTDIHGSDLCFRKFLGAAGGRKRADVLVIGGDILGKVLVPIVHLRSGHYQATSRGRVYKLESKAAVREFELALAAFGTYGHPCGEEEAEEVRSNPELAESVLTKARIARLERWLDLAERRLQNSTVTLIINPGNDDPFYVDGLLRKSAKVIVPEGIAVELPDGLTMISTGYTNRTPWNCPRDIGENELAERIRRMTATISDFDGCIFNFHAPPFGTGLDLAPEIDAELRPVLDLGGNGVPVGSVAVLEAIRECQPLVGLHGHVHESHAFALIGRTMCFNPGSDYENGNLQGVFLEIGSDRRISFYGLTREDG